MYNLESRERGEDSSTRDYDATSAKMGKWRGAEWGDRGTLHMRQDDTEIFVRSNDRPNVYLTVERLRHAAKSFQDLNFLIPKDWKDGDPHPPKFILFFDNIKEG